MTIAETLAERIAAVRFDALPPDAVHWARVAILDTVGCTLAGASEPCARIVARVSAPRASQCGVDPTSRFSMFTKVGWA